MEKSKWVVLFLVALAVLSMAVAPVASQANNSTTTQANDTTTVEEDPEEEFIGDSDYTYDELSYGGEKPSDSMTESLRFLGDPPMGSVELRRLTPSIMDEIMGSTGGYSSIENGETVRQNEVQLYGSAFGPTAGEYTLVTVYWQPESSEVDNQTVRYAKNQTTERQKVDIGGDGGFTQTNVSLTPHYDETYHVTQWLEEDGERVEGAQWHYIHRSNPGAQSVNIGSLGGAWAFAIKTAVIPGVVSLIVGLLAARFSLRLTGRGPGYGVEAWLFMVGLASIIVLAVAYYQIAVILTNIPYVLGLFIGVVAFGAGLTFHQPAKQVGFFRRELYDAKTGGSDIIRKAADGDADVPFGSDVDGSAELFDELTEALYVDLPSVPAVRTDDGYRVPVVGIGPWFARLFADAALLDLSGIATRMKVRMGKLDDIIVVDPESDPALEHKPAHLVRVLPIDTIGEDPKWYEQIYALLATVAIVAGPPVVGWIGASRVFDVGIVGLLAGLAVTAIVAYSAEDGWIDFEAAPEHYKKAEDNLTMLQRAFAAAKEDESGQRRAWDERATTAKEAREQAEAERETVTDVILDSLGVSATDPELSKSGEEDGN